MANITVKNPKLVANTAGTAISAWSIGANLAWSPSLTSAQSNSVDGSYGGAGDNTFYQVNVFSDFASSVSHRIKVNVAGAILPLKITVMFGTVTATTITAAGVQFITATAAGNATLSFDILQGAANLEYITDATLLDIKSISAATNSYFQPVYNPIWFDVTSINTAQANFKYVFDVFTGATTTGNSLARIKLLPRPGGSSNCIFSPARVLESYLSYDVRIQNIVVPTNSANHVTPYTIKFGEEFGVLTTGTTVYSALTTFSAYTFNGVLQYEQVPTWNPNLYFPGDATRLFLTNQPRTGVYIKNTTDRGTLSFCQLNLTGLSTSLVTYQNSGGTKTYKLAHTGITSQIVHLPSGIWNLNNIPNSGTTVNINTDYKYTLQVTAGAGVYTEALLYLIDDRCSKYSTVRIQFLNRFGGFDYFNFNLVSKKSISIKRGEYRKVLDYNYQLGDRGNTVLDVDGQYSYKAQSDWVTDEEAAWLEELFTTNEAYVINSDGTATPIIIEDTTYDIKKSLNDKLFNLSISYQVASKYNGQRN